MEALDLKVKPMRTIMHCSVCGESYRAAGSNPGARRTCGAATCRHEHQRRRVRINAELRGPDAYDNRKAPTITAAANILLTRR